MYRLVFGSHRLARLSTSQVCPNSFTCGAPSYSRNFLEIASGIEIYFPAGKSAALDPQFGFFRLFLLNFYNQDLNHNAILSSFLSDVRH